MRPRRHIGSAAFDLVPPRAWNMHHGKPEGPATVTVNGITRARLVYVGRSRQWGGPSPLANQWCPKKGPQALAARTQNATPHDDPLGMYRAWLWQRLLERDERVLAALDAIPEDGLVGCTCAPRPCHADIVIKAWLTRRAQVPVDSLLEGFGWRLPTDAFTLALVHEAIRTLDINDLLDRLRAELGGPHPSYALEPIGRELGERWECPSQLVALEERRAA